MFSLSAKLKKADKVFISIASFCDDDLINTIQNILSTASSPKNLIFGICLQDTPENLEQFPYNNHPQFRIIPIISSESKGCCWARAKIQTLYQGEKYYLQLDSHCRLVPKWDNLCKDWLKLTGAKKPILSSYLIAFDKKDTELNYLKDVTPYSLSAALFYDNDKLRIEPVVMHDYKNLQAPQLGHLFSAHFVFTFGAWIKEVPYDEALYFEGEEDTLSVRSFCAGWDIFHPHRAIGYHYYTRNQDVKHHDLVAEWHSMHERSLARMRQVLGMDSPSITLNQFGLKDKRTLEQFETLSGVSFKTRTISGSTRNELQKQKLWHYVNGWFKKDEQGVWSETQNEIICNEFSEIEHNPKQLILYDGDRDIFIKIEANKSYFKTKEKSTYTDWVQFNSGSWSNTNPQSNRAEIEDRLKKNALVFNEGKKNAILSLRTPNTVEWAQLAAINQLAYALKHDFTYHLYEDLVVLEDIPHWNKVKLIMYLLPKYDYVVWFDSDAIVTNFDKTINEIIAKAPDKDLFVCDDIGGWQLNTGVLIVKNTPWSISLFDHLWSMDHIPHSKGAEQSSLISLLAMNDPKQTHWHLFNQKEFNCHPKAHEEGDFVLHMMGLSGEERYRTFDYWNTKHQVYPSTEHLLKK